MKYKKKQLLQMMDALEKKNQVFAAAIPGKLKELAGKDVFAECQQKAIEIGTCLEAQGEGAQSAVGILEDYCEAVYQASVSIGNEGQCRKLSKKMRKQLLQIRNAIKYAIPEDKREVVFFPYKASMWDSLESLWMAARDDPGWDTYVVPIPYFDKNPDGSLRDMHYEGKEYPGYVPVTDWRKYSIKEHRPDVACIHNPYDEYNYVTTVHPDYYAPRLKQYTDMLVYCPYFVGINGRVAEHLCTAQGIFYADRVIVESEAVRKIYVEAIRKFEKENKCAGYFGDLEKKIKASSFGSPKVERIKRVTREDLDIPYSWERLVLKEDGTRKKVILYNTTIDAALKKGEQFIEKVGKVLSIFKANEGCVLLWRPHPLLMSTLYAMRPELYQKMSGIMETYREEQWGIYDDTADIDRAILYSDAYYGDWSSVVTLYRVTGKPIMIASYEE